ncbi:MAG: peptidoglycan DD-metalloendopeptidase family protein [Sphingobacteriales bacterium]|nr:peptidoglycan DD-metalloendopeptidase family protein [Sphingobacteriales bacterium]
MNKMLIISVIFLGFGFEGFANDTLQFPIANGVIKYSKVDSMLYVHPNGIKIFTTTDYKILSCSQGKVAGIAKLKEESYVIAIESDKSYYYVYGSIDSVVVKKNQVVRIGQVLGLLNKKEGNEEFITFSVMRKGKILEAERFVRRKKI